jgi:hypothetical protein
VGNTDLLRMHEGVRAKVLAQSINAEPSSCQDLDQDFGSVVAVVRENFFRITAQSPQGDIPDVARPRSTSFSPGNYPKYCASILLARPAAPS